MKNIKVIKTENYNLIFNPNNGLSIRWGKTKKDDPEYSPVGPEIADIEISTICNGLGKPCEWCYKSNTHIGENMSLETFKKVFNVLPKTLTQIAFGIGDIHANKELYDIMNYCNENGVIPNITINGYGLYERDIYELKRHCGAVAVSRYKPVYYCYDAVSQLINAGMKQVNIHQLLSNETFDDCMELLDDRLNDKRLKKLNSIVFLSLKPKGNRNTYTPITNIDKLYSLIEKALNNNIPFGFDSCFASTFDYIVDTKYKDHKLYNILKMVTEPCESGLFSIYINTKGVYYPCSFSEGLKNIKGIDLLKINDFMKDVWYSDNLKNWRDKLLNNKTVTNCRYCPIYNIYPKIIIEDNNA